MTLSLILLFSLLSILSLGKLKDKTLEKFLMIMFFISILIIIIFRNGNHCPDYKDYVYFYNNIEKTTYSIEFSLKIIISILNKLQASSLALFFVYGLLGYSLKYKLIKEDCYPFIALLGYVSYELPNQEMTAIRAGVATGFVLLSLLFYDYDKKKYFIYGLLGTFFHYSAIVFIGYPIIHKFKSKKGLLFIFIVSLVLPFFIGKVFYTVLGFINIPFLQAKLHQYAMNNNTIANTFRMSSILRYLIFLTLWYKIDLIKTKNPDINSHLAIFLTGIFLNSLFSFNKTFQYRFSNIFYTMEIFLYKNFIYIFKNKMVGRIVILLICALDLFYVLFSVNIFGGY